MGAFVKLIAPVKPKVFEAEAQAPGTAVIEVIEQEGAQAAGAVYCSVVLQFGFAEKLVDTVQVAPFAVKFGKE